MVPLSTLKEVPSPLGNIRHQALDIKETSNKSPKFGRNAIGSRW